MPSETPFTTLLLGQAWGLSERAGFCYQGMTEGQQMSSFLTGTLVVMGPWTSLSSTPSRLQQWLRQPKTLDMLFNLHTTGR